MPPFKIDDCAIPSVWCGNGSMPKRKKGDETFYRKTGDRLECMKKGFGAGKYTERDSHLPAGSLQKIKYVGEIFEEKFKKEGINTIPQLLKKMGKLTPKNIETILKKVFTRKGGGIDKRAYNSTLVYLYRHGTGNLPSCSKITV